MENVFVHPQALCESSDIGSGTRIWAFTHLLPGARLGQDCNICDNVFVENDVIVGDRVTVKCGVQLWDGVRIGDDVFVGPNVTFTNDPFPRSKLRPVTYSQTFVRAGASIGANATILPGLEIGANAMVGAGAVVTRNVPNYAIVVGNPAKIVGYTNTKTTLGVIEPAPQAQVQKIQATTVKGVSLHELHCVEDMRGSLTVADVGKDVPFEVKRFFLVFDVPSREVRGEHAHVHCKQFLVATRGSVRVVADDGLHREEFLLDCPNKGLYLPPMTWGVQYKYSPDAVLMVLASRTYETEDYIRDYADFLVKARESS